MGEGVVEGRENLLEEGECVLGGAVGHLHALEPYLDRERGTWWSWSLEGCMPKAIIIGSRAQAHLRLSDAALMGYFC